MSVEMMQYPTEAYEHTGAFGDGTRPGQEMEEEARRRRGTPARRVIYRYPSRRYIGRRPSPAWLRPIVRPRPPVRGVRPIPIVPVEPYERPLAEPPRTEPSHGEPAPSEPGPPPLEGSEYVRWLQSTLNRVLGLQLVVDGIMHPSIRAATRDFQQRQGLPVSGVVGPDTERALTAIGRTSPPPPQEFEADRIRSTIRIHDRTSVTPKNKRIRQRDPRTVNALVLHQMAFSRGSDPAKYNNVTAHYAILPDGKILHLHPISALLYASNGFNARSVAVEFAGNLPDTRGKCWSPQTHGCNRLTQAQIEAGRYLIQYLIKAIGLKFVFTHRQSYGMKENDPGPDIWYYVGQWAIQNLRLGDGGPGFRLPKGKPIPDSWRSWGRRTPAAAASRPASRTPAAPAPSQATPGRPDIVTIRGIKVARQISANLEALLAAAEAAGFRLSGGGFRSHQEQLDLRRKHCGPTPYDIYQKPSNQCHPPTARPGHSMHEQGLAIDFKHNGRLIKSRNDPAFRWLAKNAARFGFHNLPSEPWHWSVNGR